MKNGHTLQIASQSFLDCSTGGGRCQFDIVDAKIVERSSNAHLCLGVKVSFESDQCRLSNTGKPRHIIFIGLVTICKLFSFP